MNNKLVEELKDLATYGHNKSWRQDLLRIINSAAKADEPKDCGFTLATCPYERCSGITKRKAVTGKSYAECKKSARAYLLSLPDLKKGGE